MQKSIHSIYPSLEGDKDPLEKFRENVVGGPSIGFTRKAVVDETFIRKSANKCKSIKKLISANYTPTRRVNPCPPDFIRFGI